MSEPRGGFLVINGQTQCYMGPGALGMLEQILAEEAKKFTTTSQFRKKKRKKIVERKKTKRKFDTSFLNKGRKRIY